MRGLVRLGSAHLVVVVSTGVAIFLAAFLLHGRVWQEHFIREVVLPRMAHEYGFELGTVVSNRDNVRHENDGFVTVSAGGGFARIGVRQHDVVFNSYGQPATLLYFVLTASERGEAAAFSVINAADWSAGGDAPIRTIRVPPRNTPR